MKVTTSSYVRILKTDAKFRARLIGVPVAAIALWVGIAVTGTTLAGSTGAGVRPVVASSSSFVGYATPTSNCGSSFVGHRLPHTTRAPGVDVLPYDTNGSGLALGDLDGDGRVDVVLGDLKGPASILWNKGGFQFEKTALGGELISETETRALAVVDFNRDGRLDVVASHTAGSIAVWLNQGNRTFESTDITAVKWPAYAMMWDDINGDGNLDFVTGSYDALLEKVLRDQFMATSGGGDVVYTGDGKGGFVGNRLVQKSQTLAMTLFDINGDGKRDLIAGNDFGVPDGIWTQDVAAGSASTKWTPAKPFKRITRNTMGFTVADYNRDGLLDLFATDMKPNLGDVKSVAGWMPLMQKSFERLQRSDIQRAENVLQKQTSPGHFSNKGYNLGIDATGWSWSAQFGDLDNSGTEDLYVVNGMIDHEVLNHMHADEIVEKNVAFSVNAKSEFTKMPTWGLEATASGRSMAMVDLNEDGRLDVVVNNLRSPAMLYENQLCGGGSSLEVDLVWEGKQNRSGLGSVVQMKLGDGSSMQRPVQGASGYLTGLDGRVHFGIPKDTKISELTIVWPDGKQSIVKTDKTNGRLRVTRKSEV